MKARVKWKCTTYNGEIARTKLAGGAEAAGDAALEVVRQESVEEGVETAVNVGETRARNLDDDYPGGHG